MRFTEIVNEDASIVEQIYSIIRNDCSEFLNETGFKPLWRGFTVDLAKQGSPLLSKSTVAIRNPRDTDLLVHEIVDEWFNNNFGHRYRSNKAVFTTHAFEGANQFGQPALVFPKGHFEYCWSPNVEDLTSELHYALKAANLGSRPTHVYRYSTPPIEEYESVIGSLLSKSGYITNNLQKVYTSGKMPEVMIHCDKYYIVLPELLDIIGMTPRHKATSFMDGLRNAKP